VRAASSDKYNQTLQLKDVKTSLQYLRKNGHFLKLPGARTAAKYASDLVLDICPLPVFVSCLGDVETATAVSSEGSRASSPFRLLAKNDP
jgi:hypothetical protein